MRDPGAHDSQKPRREPQAGLPVVRLREIQDDDETMLARLITPEVEGEWNIFDDPPEERLSGSDYGGGARIVQDDGGTPVGIVTWIQIPHGPNRRSLAWNIGITILPVSGSTPRGIRTARRRRLPAQRLGRQSGNGPHRRRQHR